MRIIDLTKVAQISLESEGITDGVLEAVDLDIAYSPVIPVPGDGEEDAVEAIRTEGGRYILNPPSIYASVGGTVSAKELKIMRARYLLRMNERRSRGFAAFLRSVAAEDKI